MGSISAQTKRFTQPCGYRKRYPAVSGGDAEGERECHCSNIGIENDTQRSQVAPHTTKELRMAIVGIKNDTQHSFWKVHHHHGYRKRYPTNPLGYPFTIIGIENDTQQCEIDEWACNSRIIFVTCHSKLLPRMVQR